MTDTSKINWLAILPEPLPTSAAIEFVNDPAAGGINIFLGVTRSEKRTDGAELIALDYEAYSAMAIEQFQKLAVQVREKWPVLKLAILHRTGRVAIGEPSVVIAVSTPHRADSFEACKWLIDTLKKEVTLWKKEVWADDLLTWSGER